MEKILNIESNKIAVICEYTDENRKLIHMFMFNQDRTSYHRSFVNNHIEYENTRSYRYYRCYDCGAKTPLYTFESQKERQTDRSYMYYGKCIKCGEDIQYDSGDYDYDNLSDHHKEHDDGPCAKYWSGNNIMVFGSYIQRYFRKDPKKSGLDISGSVEEFMETVKKYLEKKKIYIIDAPIKPMSSKEFMNYLNTKIPSLEQR